MTCGWNAAAWRRIARVVCVVALGTALGRAADVVAAGDAPAGPQPVVAFDLATMAGQWFEVAASGTMWAHRRCASDTRFSITVIGPRRADVVRACTTPTGIELRSGRLSGPAAGGGALRGRFVGAAFGWVPTAWTDYWVVGMDEERRWLLIGDRRREVVKVWSRTVALDEASLAAAIAAGRAQGFDSSQVRTVPQPAGPASLVPARKIRRARD